MSALGQKQTSRHLWAFGQSTQTSVRWSPQRTQRIRGYQRYAKPAGERPYAYSGKAQHRVAKTCPRIAFGFRIERSPSRRYEPCHDVAQHETERYCAGHWSKHHQKTKRKTARADAGSPKLIEPMVGVKSGVKTPRPIEIARTKGRARYRCRTKTAGYSTRSCADGRAIAPRGNSFSVSRTAPQRQSSCSIPRRTRAGVIQQGKFYVTPNWISGVAFSRIFIGAVRTPGRRQINRSSLTNLADDKNAGDARKDNMLHPTIENKARWISWVEEKLCRRLPSTGAQIPFKQ
jgi:hypothetical protein